MPDVNQLLERLLDHSRQLYSLPLVAIEVLSLSNDPRTDAARMKTCIERDPALTTKVLRIVNSSLFGLTRQVRDLKGALAMLGTKPLKLLVLGFSLPEPLFAGVAADVLARYWKQALTRAVAAREISERLWRLPGDEAFVAGLLKDLGRLVLVQGLGRAYVEFLNKVDPLGDARALERQAIGFDHAQLTGGLLAQWGLPDSLVEAVAEPDLNEPLRPGGNPLREIVCLADMMARMLSLEQTAPQAALWADVVQVARTRHRAGPAELAELISALEEKVGQLAQVLCVQLPAGRAFDEVLAQSQSQLAQVAAEAAGELAHARRARQAPPPPSLEAEVRCLSAAAEGLLGKQGGSQPIEPLQRPAPAPSPRPPAAPVPSLPAAQPAGRSRPAAAGVVDTDPALIGRLAMAVAACRQARRPLSLLLVQLDHFDELVFTQGTAGADAAVDRMQAGCLALDHPAIQCLQVGDARFALIVPACDRRTSVELGNELLGRLRDPRQLGASPSPVSLGACTVALPPKNFPAAKLVESAERCLYAAQLAGGNCLKSIEIY